MNKNVGNIDRAIRSVAGVLAILAHMLSFVSGTVGIALLIIGIILLGTAAIGWCPPYILLGVNTCRAKTSQ